MIMMSSGLVKNVTALGFRLSIRVVKRGGYAQGNCPGVPARASAG